jgi:hypothetical protein
MKELLVETASRQAAMARTNHYSGILQHHSGQASPIGGKTYLGPALTQSQFQHDRVHRGERWLVIRHHKPATDYATWMTIAPQPVGLMLRDTMVFFFLHESELSHEHLSSISGEHNRTRSMGWRAN